MLAITMREFSVTKAHTSSRFKWYSSPPSRSSLEFEDEESIPHVTIVRPVKGLDPGLYECLRSTFLQSYPKSKLTTYLCVPSRSDPAIPVLTQLLSEYADFDAKIYAEDEDPSVLAGDLGPNPKIRQVARAYSEAKGDLIWAIDCNVWVAPHTCGRLVSLLIGGDGSRPYKFVHQLPLVVDIGSNSSSSSSSATPSGSQLESMFTSSSHAKFYTAINTVSIAPCIVGKSNLWRRSHLDALTARRGLAHFSHNICEDHLIGDVLWKRSVPAGVAAAAAAAGRAGPPWRNHGLLRGALALQPMAGMGVRDYVARRVRWLRVRKFTVLAATLVEPGTESFVCSAYGAFAVTTLPAFARLGVPHASWLAFWLVWAVSVAAWAVVDYSLYAKLHSAQSIAVDEHTPAFAKRRGPKPLGAWLAVWFGREALAFPIWFWAFWCGSMVEWRGKKLWVGWDMKVHEVDETQGSEQAVPLLNGHDDSVLDRRKDRRD